jgi:hypothetical protein
MDVQESNASPSSQAELPILLPEKSTEPCWTEITELCKTAIKELTDACPMVNIPEFSLYDAMSAHEVLLFFGSIAVLFCANLQLMEPKMDHLMNLPEPLNVLKLFRVELPSTMSDEVMVKLFQSIICQEMSFVEGSSLAEATHNCILIWQESWANISGSDTSFLNAVECFAKSTHLSLAYLYQGIVTADVYEGNHS